MNKKIPIGLTITFVIIAIAVTFSITMVAAMRIFDTKMTSVTEKANMYSKLAEIDRYIRDNDLYTSDETTLNDMLASGYMLGSGDKYAKYYTADAYADLVAIQNGTLMGIGVDAVKDSNTGYARVTKVYTGSPAEDLGITAGCYITMIEDTDVKSLTSTESILARLRGENGTTVNITWRNAAAEETTSAVTRRSYTVTTVDAQLVNDSYGYIRIRDFAKNTASELDYAISTMTAQGAKSLVFDLRDNSSTDLGAAIECIDLVCPEGTVATAQYADGSTVELGTSDGDRQVTLPVVCIVNGSTASGAELFASCARLMAGARLAGTATAGRGTVMSDPKMLSDGSAVVITTAKLLTCDGSSFDGTGLTVDAERVLSSDETAMYYDFTVDNDPQIQKAFSVADQLTGTSTVAAANEAASSQAAESAAASGAPSTAG